MNNERNFNKEEFAILLERAKGDRSINQYANDTGVSAAHISRFLRSMIDAPPHPETIAKFADKAQNDVAYRELMIAAGHISQKGASDKNEEVDKNSPQAYRREMESIHRRCKQIFLAHLFDEVAFPWSPAQGFDRDRTSSNKRRHFRGFPEIVVNIEDDHFNRWLVDIRATIPNRNRPSMIFIDRIYALLVMHEMLPTDKFTIVVNDEQAYDYFFKRPPISLRANLFVMLVDLEQDKFIKEEMLCQYDKE